MKANQFSFIPAWELANLIRSKKASPVEIVNEILERISILNPKLNAFLTVNEAEARSSAKAAEEAVIKGEELPPLHGIPISIKDLHASKGIRTTFGSPIYKNFIPDKDDVEVERVRRSGAIILGKTNTPEFGMLITTENRLGDHCRNPWNTERVTGGSSGGAAAAVAAGLGPWAQGSDGGGSIRIPAGWCGVYGLKPTQGRVPFVYALSGSISENGVVGPIARTVRDAAWLLEVMAGYDPRDPTSIKEKPHFVDALEGGVKGLKIAWTPDMGWAKVDPEVRAAVKSAALTFESLGCHVDEATPDTGEPFYIFTILVPLMAVNTASLYRKLLPEHSLDIMPALRDFILYGEGIRAYEVFECRQRLLRFRGKINEFFETYDLLILPTVTVPAFPVGQWPTEIDGQKMDTYSPGDPSKAVNPFAPIFNLTGQPAASVPVGFSPDGLPLSVMIAGRWGDEATVIRASAAFEKARPWADKIPTVCRELCRTEAGELDHS